MQMAVWFQQLIFSGRVSCEESQSDDRVEAEWGQGMVEDELPWAFPSDDRLDELDRHGSATLFSHSLEGAIG